jgi:hypothetical protein
VNFEERAIGEAMTARSIALDYYQGMGPPDLCTVTKQYNRAWLPADVAPLPPMGYCLSHSLSLHIRIETERARCID